MASTDIRTTQAAHDDLDDLFNYDVGNDDALRPPEIDIEAEAALEPRRPKPIDLGIDEEVKQRVRRPNPKLDEDRLLSKNGITKLRCISKERLRFRGKGHEFTDVERLLNLYQLWLDDLYPKAKFADGLAMIEKLGHSKRIQVMRKEWISEAKAHRDHESTPREDRTPIAGNQAESQTQPSQQVSSTRFAEPVRQEIDLAQTEESIPVDNSEPQPDAYEPEADELDALLAENDAVTAGAKPQNLDTASKGLGGTNDRFDDQYADEMDMMRDLEDW